MVNNAPNYPLFKNLQNPSKISTIFGSCHRKQILKGNETNINYNDLRLKLNSIRDLSQLNYNQSIIDFYLKEFQNGHLGSINQGIDKIIEQVNFNLKKFQSK